MDQFAGVAIDREHRKYSPSKSERFIVCPGSVNLIEREGANYTREQSEYAEEGNTAHKILEAGLRNKCTNATQSILASEYADQDFSIEFKSSINTALDYVWTIFDRINEEHGDAQLFIERYVEVPSYMAPGDAGGYCDVAIYSAIGRILYIIDYKHGAGIAKAADGNSQVKQYGAGFLFEENPLVDAASIDVVVLAIVQPRAYHPAGEIREARTSPEALHQYLVSLEGYIAATMDSTAPLVPGVDQCRFCEARSTCPALERAAVSLLQPTATTAHAVIADRLPDPRKLDVQRLAYIKAMEPVFKVFFNGVDSHIDELLRSGIDVPGFKLVETYARREWYGDVDKEVSPRLAALIGCKPDELYERKFITITDAEKRIVDEFKKRARRKKRKQAAETARKLFAYLTQPKSSGTLTVVASDDPRPPINKAFATLGQLAGLISPPPSQQE